MCTEPSSNQSFTKSKNKCISKTLSKPPKISIEYLGGFHIASVRLMHLLCLKAVSMYQNSSEHNTSETLNCNFVQTLSTRPYRDQIVIYLGQFRNHLRNDILKALYIIKYLLLIYFIDTDGSDSRSRFNYTSSHVDQETFNFLD